MRICFSDQNRHATTYCTNKVPCPKMQRKFIHKSINYAYKFTKKNHMIIRKDTSKDKMYPKF